MDAKVLATGDIMKIETEEVGINAVEADTKLFQLDSAPWKLESDDIENTKDAVLNRIPVPEITDQINIKQETDNYFVDDLASRSEHSYVKLWMKSEAEEELMVDSYLGDSEKHPVREIMEEFIIKDQCFNNDDTLLDTNAETVSNRVSFGNHFKRCTL
ncbi:unnamed protein product [Acanthoscelides obtectus]|uniref:Uncharacterized protein n=1 Tax=Acanthoscelides obtectus TaxID=200917 RepID=A0A9P0PFL5_ACAOB|nr:unnamed protein product [Acanthoscelides obtectus]CAK1681907.1 hypothetical protein AOBTE_LOCUS33325 [Acanthoscelides obtectus]